MHIALVLLSTVVMAGAAPLSTAEAAQIQIGIAQSDNIGSSAAQKAAATSSSTSASVFPDDDHDRRHHSLNHEDDTSTVIRYGKQTIAVPKTGTAPNLEWMIGRTRLVIDMVSKGRLDINNLPPKGQDHLIYPAFEDVIHANVRAVPFGSDEEQVTTYRDVYGREKTKEEYDAYRENEERMEKPYRGQLRHMFEGAGCEHAGEKRKGKEH